MEEQADRHRHLREETIIWYQYHLQLSFLAQVPPPTSQPQLNHKLHLLQLLQPNQQHCQLPHHQLLNQQRYQHYQHHEKDQSTMTWTPTAQAPR